MIYTVCRIRNQSRPDRAQRWRLRHVVHGFIEVREVYKLGTVSAHMRVSLSALSPPATQALCRYALAQSCCLPRLSIPPVRGAHLRAPLRAPRGEEREETKRELLDSRRAAVPTASKKGWRCGDRAAGVARSCATRLRRCRLHLKPLDPAARWRKPRRRRQAVRWWQRRAAHLWARLALAGASSCTPRRWAPIPPAREGAVGFVAHILFIREATAPRRFLLTLAGGARAGPLHIARVGQR